MRENSRETYRAYVDSRIKPKLGHIKLTRLTPLDIEQWQAEMLEDLSPQTIRHLRALLHQALKSALRKNLVRSNVVEQTDGPKVFKPQRYPLTVEEALTIIEGCEQVENGLAYQVLAYCGLRPEEAIGLCWSDLKISSGARGSLRVNRVVHHPRNGKGWKFYKPKTSNSERVVKFSSQLTQKLTEHRKKQLQQKLRMGKLWRDHDLVFTNDVGEPLKVPALAYRFGKLIKSLEMSEEITMYDLRHFFVTSSLVAGVDFKTVSREAGHSKVSFTMEVYGHVLDEMHDEAADKREQLLKKRSR